MKKAFLFNLALVIILHGCNQKPGARKKASDDQFTFAFLTDIHVQPEFNADEGFRMAIDTINLIAPDFVLTGGDLIRDALDQSWERSDSVYNLYNQLIKKFNMPVYNTMGNHEIFGWQRDEEEILNHPEFGKRMYENRIGERFYSFDHKGWHFIVLDAIARGDDGDYIGKVEEEQIEWLVNDLAKLDKKTPVTLSVHIPFITVTSQLSKGSLEALSKKDIISNSRDVLLMFKDYNLKLVLQGHHHFVEDIYVANQVHFITAGAVCGRWWKNRKDSIPEEGFLLVHLIDEEIEWDYVDYGWTPEVN